MLEKYYLAPLLVSGVAMDQDLFIDVSRWDEKCMQAFIKENAAMFRVFAARYMNDPEAIDDVLQEAYLRFWTHRDKIGTLRSPRNYFFSIIKNTILDKRKLFSQTPGERAEEVAGNLSDPESFLENIVEAESAGLITRAIMQLSPQSQKVILMTLDDRHMHEIAEALQVTVNTVKTIKYRALKRLSEMLSREDFLFFLFCILLR